MTTTHDAATRGADLLQTPGTEDAAVLRRRTRSELKISERGAELDLAERRGALRAAARERDRDAAERQRQDRLTWRSERHERRRSRFIAAAGLARRAVAVAGRNVLMVPILASTCSAWWFQLEAMRATGLTVALAATVATALESLGLAFAGLAHQARSLDDSAAVYRAAMWMVVAAAAAVNYRHGSPAWERPGLIGVVFALLSAGSVVGWELRERQAHRARIADRLPARRPRFGCARWIRFPISTGRALSVAVRDGLTDATDALSVVTAEAARHRSLRTARRSFGRRGRKLVAQRLSVAEQRTTGQPHGRSAATDDDRVSAAAGPGRSGRPALVRGRGSGGNPRGRRSRVTDRRKTTKQPATTGQSSSCSPGVSEGDRRSGTAPGKTARHGNTAIATTDGVDVSDLLPVALTVADDLGSRLSRDALVDGIRSRGHSVGGRRRRAIYDAVLDQRCHVGAGQGKGAI
jgi:hypothetical protein